MTHLNRSLRALALGAAALLLVSGPLATDANAIHAEDTPEWAAPEGFFIEPEAILMSFSNSNLAYATGTRTTASGSETENFHLDDDYELGFRFGIGYRWENRWSITVRWMSLDNEDHSSVDANGTTEFLRNALASDDGDGDDAEGIEGRIDRDLDIADIEIGRTWGDLDGHHMKLFFGPRYLQYDETMEVGTFEGADLVEWGMRHLDGDALGIRVGIEGHVALGMDTGWSFFGRAAVSALMADVHVRYAEQSDFDNDQDLDDEDFDEFAEHFDETVLGLEAALGFQWAHTFDSDWTFHVNFGWEVANYTDLAPSVSSSASNGSDDVGLDGAFLQFGFTW